ncbi:TonB-dependent receptor, partial [candidate division WOR-3 bacterium]|nr:TonB-dependent receptor [candidate division WOR-3 bacterium]
MRKFILLLMCVFAVSLFAGITGKIVGRIYDSSTGEALPGVNVIIEGTIMGAATDPDGYFVILNVPPGLYSITARMMGYRDVTKSDVRVEVDLTRILEFPLESEAIAVKGVIVRAKRPIIKKDVTTSVAIISAEDMEAVAINTIEGVVARQAGIIDEGAGVLHVRGGREWEVVYVLDGVEMVDPMTGGFDSHIPQESVQETSVYTGGFGAEYGSAQSG